MHPREPVPFASPPFFVLFLRKPIPDPRKSRNNKSFTHSLPLCEQSHKRIYLIRNKIKSNFVDNKSLASLDEKTKISCRSHYSVFRRPKFYYIPNEVNIFRFAFILSSSKYETFVYGGIRISSVFVPPKVFCIKKFSLRVFQF